MNVDNIRALAAETGLRDFHAGSALMEVMEEVGVGKTRSKKEGMVYLEATKFLLYYYFLFLCSCNSVTLSLNFNYCCWFPLLVMI